MNLIIGLGVSLAVMRIFRGPGERRYEPFDGLGALALLVGYPSLLIGFTLGESLGWISAPVFISFAAAAAALSGFVWIELHTAHPLIDLGIFRRRTLAGALLTVMLSHMIHHPIALCAPLFLQNAIGFLPPPLVWCWPCCLCLPLWLRP